MRLAPTSLKGEDQTVAISALPVISDRHSKSLAAIQPASIPKRIYRETQNKEMCESTRDLMSRVQTVGNYAGP